MKDKQYVLLSNGKIVNRKRCNFYNDTNQVMVFSPIIKTWGITTYDDIGTKEEMKQVRKLKETTK